MHVTAITVFNSSIQPFTIIEDYRPEIIQQEYAILTRAQIFPRPPTDSAEDQKIRLMQEMLQYKTRCQNVALNQLFDYVSQLEHEVKHLKKANSDIENCLKKHSEAVFISIAQKLYQVIRESPALTARLQQMPSIGTQVEVKALIDLLESTTPKVTGSQLWVYVDKPIAEPGWEIVEKEPEIIHFDSDALVLKELRQQIDTLQSNIDSGKGAHEFILELAELRKRAIAPANEKTWLKLYRAGADAIFLLQGIYYGASMAASAAPFVMKIAPLIFPPGWLSVLQILISVIGARV